MHDNIFTHIIQTRDSRRLSHNATSAVYRLTMDTLVSYIGYGMFIFLGMGDPAKDKKLLKELKITHTCTLGKENAPKDKQGKPDPNHLVIDIGDGYLAAWDAVFKNQDTIAFFERYFSSTEHRLVFRCLSARIRSPFAARCILIRFCNFTPFMARVRVFDVRPGTTFFLTMHPVELDLCSRADKEYDFGLKLHKFAEPVSEDYKEHFKDKCLLIPQKPEFDTLEIYKKCWMFCEKGIVDLWKKVVPVSEQFKDVKKDEYPPAPTSVGARRGQGSRTRGSCSLLLRNAPTLT